MREDEREAWVIRIWARFMVGFIAGSLIVYGIVRLIYG